MGNDTEFEKLRSLTYAKKARIDEINSIKQGRDPEEMTKEELVEVVDLFKETNRIERESAKYWEMHLRDVYGELERLKTKGE